MFTYQLEAEDNQVIIKLHGDLDIEVTEIVEQKILPLLLPFQQITFDLAKVPFVDSTGIGVLINLIDTLRKNNDRVGILIKDVQPLVQEVFEIIQLWEILGQDVMQAVDKEGLD